MTTIIRSEELLTFVRKVAVMLIKAPLEYLRLTRKVDPLLLSVLNFKEITEILNSDLGVTQRTLVITLLFLETLGN